VGGWGPNGFLARAISLKAGMPNGCTAYSVNRQCGSSVQAIADAMQEIQTGFRDIVVAGGAESLSTLPYYVPSARWGARMGTSSSRTAWSMPSCGRSMGTTTASPPRTWPRSSTSPARIRTRSPPARSSVACAAVEAGVFADEIVPVEIRGRKGKVTLFDTDEGPREGTTAESLGHLKPCFVLRRQRYRHCG